MQRSFSILLVSSLLVSLVACVAPGDPADPPPDPPVDPLDGWASTRPMGEGVVVLDGPVACPEDPETGAPFGCWVVDLAVDVRPDEPGDQGLEVRLLVPDEIADPFPVMMNFPGVGTCGTRDPIDTIAFDEDDPASTKRHLLAAEGILQANIAPRGHNGCYEPGDALYQNGDWIGPAEFEDYDELLKRFLAGNLLEDLPATDSDRVALTGGSTGAVTTLFYATHSTFPVPFALAMPSLGTPSVEAWLGQAVDPGDSIEEMDAAGLFPIPGVQAQLRSYAGSGIEELVQQLLVDDFSGLAEFALTRTAYDVTGDLDAFDAHVQRLVMQTGGRDCIVPTPGQHEFWEQLQADHDRPDDRWAVSILPHSCKEVTDRFPTEKQEAVAGGYFPAWTEELKADANAQAAGYFVNSAREILLDRPPAVPLPAPVLVTPLVQGEHSGHTSPWREVEDLQQQVTGTRVLHLEPGGTLTQAAPAPWQQVVIDHDPAGVCEVADLLQPCGESWTAGNFEQRVEVLEEIRNLVEFRVPITETITLVGSPVLDLHLAIGQPDPAAFEGAGLVAMLRYAPPDAPQDYHGWHVTQGAQFLAHGDDDGEVDLELVLDARVMTLEDGGELILQLSNLSTYVHYQPWYHPIIGPYTLELVVDGDHPATLSLPESATFESLPLADTTSLEL